VRDQARVRVILEVRQSETDKQGPMDQLASLLEGERKTKALGSKNLSTRHSRFGTTIKVQAVGWQTHDSDPADRTGGPEIDLA
jgi:hypothetical protein